MRSFENLILRTIERWWAGRYSERHGLVTSYDPKNYLAKVTFQPEGQESGWLPIETGHIGNGYGIAIGLTTGDGVSTGDQVIVRYQEGDIESGKIVQRVHSISDAPPTVQSGEMVAWVKWGQRLFFNQKGEVFLQDGGGGVIFIDGKGNITETAIDHTITASKTITRTAGEGINDTATMGDITTTATKGNVNVNAPKGAVLVQGGGAVQPPTTIPSA